MRRIVPIISGGLDSTTLLYGLHRAEDVEVPVALSFNYGQRHAAELQFAAGSANDLGIPWKLIDLSQSGLPELLSEASALIGQSQESIPEGHYAAENMKSTVVPGRNMMMLSIAASVAEAVGANGIATAVHAGDHHIYPDCRPEFIGSLTQTISASSDGAVTEIVAPFLQWSKAEIAYRAMELGVPLGRTWSCYKGGVIHCGRCGTCVERLEAIDFAQRIYFNETLRQYPDYTEYEDTDYWKDQSNANA